jgi:hypothetical protein
VPDAATRVALCTASRGIAGLPAQRPLGPSRSSPQGTRAHGTARPGRWGQQAVLAPWAWFLRRSSICSSICDGCATNFTLQRGLAVRPQRPGCGVLMTLPTRRTGPRPARHSSLGKGVNDDLGIVPREAAGLLLSVRLTRPLGVLRSGAHFCLRPLVCDLLLGPLRPKAQYSLATAEERWISPSRSGGPYWT